MSIEAWTVVFALVLFAVALPYVFRSILTIRLESKIKKHAYEDADTLMESSIYRLAFSKYELYTNKIRLKIMMNDPKAVETLTRDILNSSLTSSQSFKLASLTYYYFLNEENADICSHLLPLLEAKSSKSEHEYNEMLYRILIEHKYEDISKVEELLAENKDNGILNYLLGIQYMYKNDTSTAKKYLNHAKNSLKNTPYHSKVKALVSKL